MNLVDAIRRAMEANRIRSVRGIAYSGGCLQPFALLRDGTRLDRPLVVHLDTLTVPRSVPLRYEHDTSRMGQVGDAFASVVNEQLHILHGTVNPRSLRGPEVITGKWEFSIGIVGGTLFTIPRGKKGAINGRVFNGPVCIATKCTLDEISFTKDPGDEQTSVLIARSTQLQSPVVSRCRWNAGSSVQFG